MTTLIIEVGWFVIVALFCLWFFYVQMKRKDNQVDSLISRRPGDRLPAKRQDADCNEAMGKARHVTADMGTATGSGAREGTQAMEG